MPTITEDQYKKLKAEVETAKSEADRAQGALNQLMSRLQEEFECDSLKEAKGKLQELQEETEEAEKKYAKAFTAYEKNWKKGEAE